MLELAFILFTITVIDAQLELVSVQTGLELDMRCILLDAQPTGMSHVVSLVISKSDVIGETILASVTPFDDLVTHNLENADVTSNMTWEVTKKLFLNIHWSRAKPKLNGNYTCKLNGLDNDNLPLMISAMQKLELQDLEPSLTATPNLIQLGLTRTLDVKCAISDFSSAVVSQLISIEMSSFHDGIDQLLASANIFSGVHTRPGVGSVEASGFIGNISQENFLQLTWTNPSYTNAGLYICEMTGLNGSSPVSFVKGINVTAVEPTTERLVDRIHSLEVTVDYVTEKNNQLSLLYQMAVDEINKLQKDLDRTTKAINFITPVSDIVTTDIPDIVTTANPDIATTTIPDTVTKSISCTFEDGMCDLIHVHSSPFKWMLNSGPVPSNLTGPANDHTYKNSKGKYLYIKGFYLRPHNRARLETVKIYWDISTNICVNFWYNIQGKDTGLLNVYKKENDTVGTAVWSKQGDQGPLWKEAVINISPGNSNFSIVFEAVMGGGYESVIALDDLIVKSQPCS